MTTPSASPADAFVVGVDFGTLSGRAVVVRVRDGAELGERRHRVPPRRDRPRAARTAAARCRPTGRCRSRRTTSTCCATAVPGGRPPAAGIDPADVIGIGTDFTACTMVPTTADGTPLYELPGVRRPPARLRQAVEAPRRPAAGRPDQRARRRARRAWLPRYGGLISSEWEFAKGLQILEEDPEVYAAMDALGRGRRLDRLAAVPARTSATPAPPATRGSTRTARYPSRGLPGRAQPRLRGLRRRQARAPRSASSAQRAGRLTAEAAAWTGLPRGHRRGRRQRRRARHRAGRATPSSRARWSRSWARRPATS